MFIFQDTVSLCCSTRQLRDLETSFAIPKQFLEATCPTCWYNFRKNFCDMTCSPHQASFVKADRIVTGPGFDDHAGQEVEMVESVTYFASDPWVTDTYTSCKDVQVPALGGSVMDFLCGPWGGADCSPHRLFNFLGSLSNGYAPFAINYEYSNDTSSADGHTYHGPHVVPCDEVAPGEGAACGCNQCSSACPKPIQPTPPIDCFKDNEKCEITGSNLLHTYTNVELAEECQLLCEDELLCVAFTHFGEESTPFQNDCLLFSSCVNRRTCEDCITGTSQDDPTCVCSIQYSGVANGNNLVEVVGGVAGEPSCKQQCTDNTDCNVYTYYDADDDDNLELCLLLSNGELQEPVSPCDNCRTGPASCRTGQQCTQRMLELHKSPDTNVFTFS